MFRCLARRASAASFASLDAIGNPTNWYNGSSFTTYYYVLNLQGDVVKLVNASGTAVATYTYNAWGEVLTATDSMASINPLRYRGYYYDTETGFYYLQSRYYDPANHRFINADVYTSTDSSNAIAYNMFAYCGNNPFAYSDETRELVFICSTLDTLQSTALAILTSPKPWTIKSAPPILDRALR